MYRKYIKLFGAGLAILMIFAMTAGFGIAIGSNNDSAQVVEKVKIIINDEDAAIDWVSMHQAILELGKSKDVIAEDVLIQVLKREKELRLTPESTLPDVMPPLEMLKAASIISLEKMNSKKSIPDIERVYRSTKHQVLRDIASDAIRKLNR